MWIILMKIWTAFFNKMLRNRTEASDLDSAPQRVTLNYHTPPQVSSKHLITSIKNSDLPYYIIMTFPLKLTSMIIYIVLRKLVSRWLLVLK